MIVAVSPEGVIGVEGKIPWHYSGDMKRFKRVTTGATVIMGRRTWESMGSKPLKERRNIVITRQALAGVETFRSIDEALAACTGDVWFIGGEQIYREAMRHADVIDVTYVPDHVDRPGAVRFPPIDENSFEAGALQPHPDDSRLQLRRYTRR